MPKKAILIPLFVFISIITILIILLIIWAILSPGKIRKYKDKNSLSEKYTININGCKNGFFINSIDINNPVLLLVSSGPGSDDYFLTSKYKDMNLEQYYTIVYWDYRGMGIAYDKNINIDDITLDNLVDDCHEVTKYLKEKFNKDKIFLMGFSGGSTIALNTAKAYPTDYYALINMAEVVTDSSDRDTSMYNFMKEVFTKKKQKKLLKKLEDNTIHLDNNKVKCKSWDSYVMLVHDAGGGTILNKSEKDGITIPIILARCYTIKEKINYIKSLKMYKKSPLEKELVNYDYRVDINNIDIPIYFISGEYDYNCPVDLVEDYYNIISAPKKGFYKIKNAAHSPLWENPSETIKVLINIKEDNLYEG